MRRHRRNHLTIVLAALATLTGLLGAEVVAQDDPIPSDYFPQIGFLILDQAERRLFIDLAESELCPCPGPPQSLSACLLEVESRCSLSEQVASRMMRLIKEDQPSDAVRDGIVRFITDAQTPRELDLSDAPRLGPEDAPLQIVVFSDFECPYCRRFAETVGQLREELGGQMAVYFLHFPLPQHANAMVAARAAIAAQNQGQFWPFHDLVFENQDRLQRAEDPTRLLFELAEALGLDLEQFRRDLSDEGLAERPLRNRDAGRAAGVSSTPSLFINGVKYLDSETHAALRAHLNSLL